jgi:hypothetical protein
MPSRSSIRTKSPRRSAMSDRVSVRFTVLKAHSIDALRICADEPAYSDSVSDQNNLVIHSFDECNFGNLYCEEELKEAGIPYDKEWDEGGDYSAGTEYLRFTPDGKAVLKEIYDNCINPDLFTMLKIIEDKGDLAKFVLDHHEEISVLSWDKQLEYSKLYLMNQLISPD